MQRVLRKELPPKQRWTGEKANGKKNYYYKKHIHASRPNYFHLSKFTWLKIHPVSTEVDHLCTCNPGQFSLLDYLEHFQSCWIPLCIFKWKKIELNHYLVWVSAVKLKKKKKRNQADYKDVILQYVVIHD